MKRYHRRLAGLCATSVLTGACRPAPASMSMSVPVPFSFLQSAVSPVFLHWFVPGFSAGGAGQVADQGRLRCGWPTRRAGHISHRLPQTWFAVAVSAAPSTTPSLSRMSGFMQARFMQLPLRVFVAILPLMLPVPGARSALGSRSCLRQPAGHGPDDTRMASAFLPMRRRRLLPSGVLHCPPVVSLVSILHDRRSAVLQGAAQG